MPTELTQLVHDTVATLGSTPPALLADDAVALRTDAAPFYLVGLIGGKDVGKSALVNALAGAEITRVTSFGEGTAAAVAYAHRSIAGALKAMLDRDVPGRYTLIAHDQPSLTRQVLVDLPDFDSRYQSHLELTRTLLRRNEYPIWVQSIEKYADLTPQQMRK